MLLFLYFSNYLYAKRIAMAAAIQTPTAKSTSLGVVSKVFGNKVKQRFAIELFHGDGIDSRAMPVEKCRLPVSTRTNVAQLLRFGYVDDTRHLQI